MTRMARFTMMVERQIELDIPMDELVEHEHLNLTRALASTSDDYLEDVTTALGLSFNNDERMQDFVMEHGVDSVSPSVHHLDVDVYEEEGPDAGPVTYEVTFLLTASGGDSALASARSILGERPHQVRVEVQP